MKADYIGEIVAVKNLDNTREIFVKNLRHVNLLESKQNNHNNVLSAGYNSAEFTINK